MSFGWLAAAVMVHRRQPRRLAAGNAGAYMRATGAGAGGTAMGGSAGANSGAQKYSAGSNGGRKQLRLLIMRALAQWGQQHVADTTYA